MEDSIQNGLLKSINTPNTGEKAIKSMNSRTGSTIGPAGELHSGQHGARSGPIQRNSPRPVSPPADRTSSIPFMDVAAQPGSRAPAWDARGNPARRTPRHFPVAPPLRILPAHSHAVAPPSPYPSFPAALCSPSETRPRAGRGPIKCRRPTDRKTKRSPSLD